MDYLDVGIKFASYEDLSKSLAKYCSETNTKFKKSDARKISVTRGFSVALKSSLLYSEIKFACVNKRLHGCPAYFRLKATEDGEFLQVIALNVKHNHKNSSTSEEVEQNTSESSSDEEEGMAEYIQVVLEDTSDGNVQEFKSSKSFEFTFRGLIAPVFTPFNKDLTLNESIIPDYADFLLKKGIKGLLVNGTSGEGMSMSAVERKKITDLWIRAAKETKQHIMVQVGGAPLPDVLDMATHAEQLGANSILCLPELYIKPNNPQELCDYLLSVSKAAPNTPLLYYHIPMFTNVNIHMGKFLREYASCIPTFCGIKFTSTMLDEGWEALNAHDRKYAVFLGADTILLGAYAMGFDSAIATTLNIFPELGIKILEEFKKGNVSNAQIVQEKLNVIISKITKNGGWVPTMKEAMNLATPINVGTVRQPLKALTVQEVQEMKNDFKNLQ